MNVLIFMTQFYQLSGAERLAIELAEELNKRGIHAEILSMYTENLSGVSNAINQLLDHGIPIVRFLGLKVHPSILSLFPAFLRLRKLLIRGNFDIVETSMLTPSLIASLATIGTRVRHITGLHHVFRKSTDNSMRYKLWRFSINLNKHNRFYAVSDFVAKAWVKYSKTPPQHTRRIYNAIPDDCFQVSSDKAGVYRELCINTADRLSIYVGRLAAYKGIDTLLDALGPVLELNHITLLYTGLPDYSVPGTKEMLELINQRISENQWNNRVKFLGNRIDVPRLLASCDILVHPTRTEAFGLALVEALSAGLPVVATNVEGIPEVLDGTDTILVPPDDPMALRKAVLQTLNRTPEETALAIAKGRKRAEKFRITNRINDMVKFFEEVIHKRF
jgi:glycosyltransferase involved in cell wall biosynthesis